MDLPDGVRGRAPHYRIRSARDFGGSGLVCGRKRATADTDRRDGVWRGWIAGSLHCGAGCKNRRDGCKWLFRCARESLEGADLRDVWGLLKEFGDAELASLIAPRTLIVEASQGPEVAGPPPETEVHRSYACPNGKLTSPPLESVKGEVGRARTFFAKLNAEDKLQLIANEGGLPGSEPTLRAFLRSIGISASPKDGRPPVDSYSSYDPTPRLQRQFNQMVDFTQALIRKSPDCRKEFWKNADATSIESWKNTTKFYRDYVWDEVIGRISSTPQPCNPRTRLILDEAKFKGYEVMLDVWPDVFAYGILLVPKDIKPGERRPAVVCQHGLEGRPSTQPIRRSTITITITSRRAWRMRGLSLMLRKIPTSATTIFESFSGWGIHSNYPCFRSFLVSMNKC